MRTGSFAGMWIGYWDDVCVRGVLLECGWGITDVLIVYVLEYQYWEF